MAGDLIAYLESSGSRFEPIFDLLRSRATDVYGAMVATTDGRSVFEQFEGDLSPAKVAAMTSSTLALAESMARECGQKQCRFVILENDKGLVVVVRISPELILMTLSRRATSVGLLLACSRATARLIVDKILADYPRP